MRSIAACAALLCSIALISRADEPANPKDADLTTRRNELMQKQIASLKVESKEAGFPESFNARPIFRYTDPARNYVGAAMWKLGDTGRPQAIVTTELNRQFFGRPIISFEYLSLTQTKFSVTGDNIRWSPKDSALSFTPVAGTEAPEATPQRRLLQMRAIAKRFTGEEVVEKETCQLRLLPQPVDRYTPSMEDHADGAIFIMAFGTNPEVLLLIESDGRSWSYAAGRLTGAEQVKLSIDGTTAWEGPPVKYGFDQPYDSSYSPIDIPGVARDGSEIKD